MDDKDTFCIVGGMFYWGVPKSDETTCTKTFTTRINVLGPLAWKVTKHFFLDTSWKRPQLSQVHCDNSQQWIQLLALFHTLLSEYPRLYYDTFIKVSDWWMTVVLKFRRQKAVDSTTTQLQLNVINTGLTLMLTCGNCTRGWTRTYWMGQRQNNPDICTILFPTN